MPPNHYRRGNAYAPASIADVASDGPSETKNNDATPQKTNEKDHLVKRGKHYPQPDCLGPASASKRDSACRVWVLCRVFALILKPRRRA